MQCSLFVLIVLDVRPLPACSATACPPPRPASCVSAGGDQHLGGGVIYRRGELSEATIDSDWPHQVALPAYRCTGSNYVTIRLFCEGLSLCDRGHSFYRDGADFNVFCFAERDHAGRFREQFGGEFIDPKDRPKWPGFRR